MFSEVRESSELFAYGPPRFVPQHREPECAPGLLAPDGGPHAHSPLYAISPVLDSKSAPESSVPSAPQERSATM